MTTTLVTEILRDAVWVILKVSGPILGIALVIGLIIALFQALTQIQEMTLTFVPKIAAVLLTLIATMPFIMGTLISFTQELFGRIPQLLEGG